LNRILAILLAFALILVASACVDIQASGNGNTSEPSQPTSIQSQSEQSTSEPTNTTESSAPMQTQYVNAFGHPSYAYKVGTLQRLGSISSLIVLVTAQNGSIEIRSNQPDPAKGIFPHSYVLTPVKIDYIYWNDLNRKVGDTIKIEEYYGTWPSITNPDVLIIYVGTFQLPMEVGKQYVLFLTNPQFDGDYGMARGDMGKYVYDEKTKTVDSVESFNSLSNLDLGIADIKREYIPQEYYDVAYSVFTKYMLNQG
jgi:hypothetical protein